jgi:uncharacterized membrane protein YfcA
VLQDESAYSMDFAPFTVAPSGVAAAVAAGLLGGFVRGCSGFGFALAAVPVLTLALPPAQAVPAVLPLEMLLGFATVPGQRGNVSWPTLQWLLAGTIIGTPLGVAFLAMAPASLMRPLLGGVVLVAVAILWSGRVVAGLLQPRWLSLFGFVSGCLNGSTAMSGPPAIIALLGSPLSPQTARATLMAFIAMSATLAVLLTAARGLYDAASVIAMVSMLPAGLFGTWAGSRAFGRLPAESYRQASLAMLSVITVGAFIASLWNTQG